MIEVLLRHTLDLEAKAISLAARRVEAEYPKALDLILPADTVVFSGMGKSGFIAQKAASTFRSLGTPAHYLHPGEASHGDLGALTFNSTVAILSHSGETPELADLIRHCEDTGIRMVAITSTRDSTLAQAVSAALCYGPVTEACPHGLAPTTSTTVALTLCDALAVDVAKAKGITPDDFKRLHPGGKLGKKLRPVYDFMHRPSTVHPNASLLTAAMEMTGPVPGIVLVVDKNGVVGVVTDGDLRRAIERKFTVVSEAMSAHPLSICETARAEDAAALMQKERVTKLFIEDALGAVVGVVNLHDCQ